MKSSEKGWRIVVWLLLALSPPAAIAQTVSFQSAGQSASEGAGSATVTLELSAPAASDLRIPLSASGSAQDPGDYTLVPSGFPIVPAGLQSVAVEVALASDALDESDETILLDLAASPDPGAWWDAGWRYRVRVTIGAAGVDRLARHADVPLDVGALFAGLGETGAFAPESLRVHEIDPAGAVVQADVPFQFDPGPGYDALTNPVGTLVVWLAGATPAAGERLYDVYFDVVGAPTAPAAVAPLVALAPDVVDEGQLSFQIDTLAGSYFYHQQGGGFASLVDVGLNDWIDYHPTGGSSGNFRGIPNLHNFHPGLTEATSAITSQGPLKLTLRSEIDGGSWAVQWEILPETARLTVLAAAAPYWFLYEGTPGGVFESGTDLLIRSDGTQTPASQSFTGDLAADEWALFADPNVGRSLFVAHHEDDAHVDSYFPYQEAMTVFGFGRETLSAFMTDVPQHFTIGLLDATTHAAAAPHILSATRDLDIEIGSPSDRDVPTAVASGIVQHTLTILDDDPEPGVRFTSAGQTVSEEGPLATVTVALDAVSGRDVLVPVALGGNAQPGVDYALAPSGAVAIAAGSLSASWVLTPLPDAAPEGAEGAVFDLLPPTHATIVAPAEHVVLIEDGISPSGIVSDDFNACALDTQTWTAVDPVGDGAVEVSGAGQGAARVLLSVPAGTSHHAYLTNDSLRLSQPAGPLPLQLEVRFDSVPSQDFQIEGILVEEADGDFILFDFVFDGFLAVFAATRVDGVFAARGNFAFDPAPGAALRMRVTQVGDSWQQTYSDDGVVWHTGASFVQSFAPVSVGPFVANPGSPPPAFTAEVDAFFDASNPPAGEDLALFVCDPVGTLELFGLAEGGQVEVTILGVAVAVPTSPGQTSAQVAAAIAAAIVADPTLAAAGVFAAAAGNRVDVSAALDAIAIGDPGLGTAAVAVPLGPAAAGWIALAVLFVALLALRPRRAPPVGAPR